MNPTPPRSIQLREEARKRLVEALTSESIPSWISGEAELQTIARRVVAMKEWLLTGGPSLAESRTSFTAEEIMERLGMVDWRTLGVVNAALHELAGQGMVAILDPGAPAVFTFREKEPLKEE